MKGRVFLVGVSFSQAEIELLRAYGREQAIHGDAPVVRHAAMRWALDNVSKDARRAFTIADANERKRRP